MKRILLMITLLIEEIIFSEKLSGPRYRIEGDISSFPYPNSSYGGT